MKKVLITDKVHPLLIEGLEELGYHVDYDTSVDMNILPHIIHLYEGIVINSKIKMNKEIIDLGLNLKFIGRLGSGMEIIDKAYALSKGIAAVNSPEGNRNAVAEHAVGMILAIYNNLWRSHNEVKNFVWNREQNRGLEIKGKTIGIIGLGHTGEQFARKFQSWDCTILTYDKYRTDYPKDLDFIKHVSLDLMQQEADIISFHLPLNDETKHFCNTDFLKACKKQPLIVNTSRGNVVETSALIDALEKNTIFGACIDVFENENPASFSQDEILMYSKLYSFDNVILSPHIAGWTKESLEGIASVLLEKIKIAVQ
jgi:D-3-phosphoglycerate dehydrogenase